MTQACFKDVRKGKLYTDMFQGSNDVILRLRADMDMALDHIAPESLNWQHTDEGAE